MSHRVTYREKNGTIGTAAFPTLTLATMYAGTAREGKVEPGGQDEVRACKVRAVGAPHEQKALDRRIAITTARLTINS